MVQYSKRYTPVQTCKYTFPDTRISELVVKYATQEIVATPELNKFITDGFITREEVRANRQFNVTSTALRTTRKALYISTAGVLFTLVFNIYNSFLRDSNSTGPSYQKDIQYYESIKKILNLTVVILNLYH